MYYLFKYFPKIETISYIFKSCKNPLTIIFFRLFRKYIFSAKLKNGDEFIITNENDWNKFIIRIHLYSKLPSAKLGEDSISFTYKNRDLSMVFGKYNFDTIFEIFAFDPYKTFLDHINVSNKTVVDIGAAFGDTAIYFILNGAAFVYGYEAFPGYASLAKENIKINNYENKCKIFNKAVGSKNGFVELDPHSVNMFGFDAQINNTPIQIEQVSLRNIVDTYKIKNAVLKIDIEGFEYEIFENIEKNVLRKFEYLLIEYHYGPENIEKIIKKFGYTFFRTGPTDVYVEHLNDDENKKMKTGHIIAKRI